LEQTRNPNDLTGRRTIDSTEVAVAGCQNGDHTRRDIGESGRSAILSTMGNSTANFEPLNWAWYSLDRVRKSADGTIVVSAGGFSEGVGIWDGFVDIQLDNPDYLIWLWLLKRFPKTRLISSEEFPTLKIEFEREKSKSHDAKVPWEFEDELKQILVLIEPVKEVACPVCQGSGNCFCIRKGAGHPNECPRCGGIGHCRYCKGTGKN
jgi:hypothetical protein